MFRFAPLTGRPHKHEDLVYAIDLSHHHPSHSNQGLGSGKALLFCGIPFARWWRSSSHHPNPCAGSVARKANEESGWSERLPEALVAPLATRGKIRHKRLILNSQTAYELKLAVSWLALHRGCTATNLMNNSRATDC